MVDVCLLGCGGSLPTPERSLTSLLVSYNGRKILIDCGEGTQVSMKMVGWGFKNIDVICFTHYHADHVMGLTGLLLTIANSGRELPLTIIGPNGLSRVVSAMKVLAPELPYEIDLVELDCRYEDNFQDKIFQMEDMIIRAIPVEHSIECIAYSINVTRGRKFDAEKAKNNGIPMKFWNVLQKGNSIRYKENVYTPDMVLGEERNGIKLVYATDTRPIDELVNFALGADLFICEGMYGEEEKYDKAIQNKHMLFSEAAAIAKHSAVKELWLTHLSPSLKEPEKYLVNASSIFPNVELGEDRKVKSFNFD